MINETTNIELINQISELKKENEILRLNSIYEISTIKKHYCKIFENLNDGFAFCKLIVENNIPTDFIYLEVNSAYEQLTGNNNIVSRKFTEIFPESKEKNPEIFQIYGSVALTGKAEKFEIYFNPLKIWLSVSAICPEKGYFIAILVDITSKKQTEQELVESNEKFKLFTENLTDVIWIFNLTQKRFTYISPSVTQLTGFSAEEALKQRIDECLTPKSIEIINKKILILTQEFLNNPKKKITDYNEIEQICKDGSIIWIETITQPQFTYNGDIEILGVSRNIDKRKHIESQLKESEKHYRSISETVPIMLYDYILNPDGSNKFLYVGPTCQEILEINDKDLLANMNLFWQMLYPYDLQRLKDEDVRANKSRDLFMSEVRIITPSGRLKWIQLSSLPNNDSEIWSGYILDITERKKAEKALTESEQKVTSILNNIPEVVWSMKMPDLSLSYISPSVEKVYGYSSKEFYENPNLWQEIIHPDDKIRINDRFQNLLEKGNAIFECRNIHRNGNVVWILYKAQLIFNENNEIVRIEGIADDITELKEREFLIQKQNQELIKLNADKDQFISILAHDLKSPFNSILGFLDLLTENIREYDIDKIEKFVNIINNSAKNTFGLLEDILLWVMANSGKIPYEPQKLNFGTVSKEVIENLKLSANTKNITINHFANDGINIFADKNMLNTVLRNIISNAIKFTNNGGKIGIWAEINHKIVTIIISDNGIGITQKLKDKLFDISQTQTTKGTENESGTGLGLLLCKEFVEKHGGTIWVESEEGKGSDFKFTMPLCNV